ncbi:MAG: hypothetical protein HPY89_04555 [Pelotomaculum sp.]|uniref:Uncharacterized protein n=1 Tax=Pelotomaculum thermopropionicum (strain DSM 13744 / JCM 10971 / SI) TaxID=370438 RepID=A5CYW6_PELTS|nr:hypothetical protein [Pelotomaculum sp.]BAF60813.1 hypothetical protein PTH_2632 [Pelotomaculum thermopropionicum SI]
MPAESKGINEAVMEAGKKSLGLIQQFLSGRVSRQALLAGLSDLHVGDILSRHWNELVSDARYVPHWQVLQTLQGLTDEMEYQLKQYGESTLHEDIRIIAMNLQRIAEQNGQVLKSHKGAL